MVNNVFIFIVPASATRWRPEFPQISSQCSHAWKRTLLGSVLDNSTSIYVTLRWSTSRGLCGAKIIPQLTLTPSNEPSSKKIKIFKQLSSALYTPISKRARHLACSVLVSKCRISFVFLLKGLRETWHFSKVQMDTRGVESEIGARYFKFKLITIRFLWLVL